MSQERPLYTLYKNLKAQNYDVPDDYDRFENALTKEGKAGADNRHAIYENLKSQNFDVPDSYERFYSALFQPASKTSSVAKGGSVPMSEADKVRFSTAASNIAFQTGQSVKNAGRYNKLKQRQDKQKKDFGRVSIGSSKTIFGNGANNVVQDVDGNYVTSDNYETNSQLEAQARQASLDESSKEYQKAVDTGEIPSVFDVRDKNGNYDLQENIGKDGTYLTEEGVQKQLDKKLEDTYARKKEIEEAMAEDNRKNGNPLLSYSANIGGSNGRDAESSDYRNKLATSLALVKQQIGSLEAVRQSPTSTWYEDAWKALDNTAFTAKTWDFGLTDFATMGQMERIKTKMDNDMPLSNSDKMLLNSKIGADAAAALEDEKMGKMYRWTKIAGQSLPFMADFFLTGGYSAITRGIAKGALKFAAKKGMGKISAAILKNTGVVVGDVIGSYAMAGTEQALKTGADIMQRHMGTLYQDGQGNYAFGTFDENGNLVREGGESFGTALYKGMTAAMIENYTEKIFGHSYGFKKGAIKFMENNGMAKTAEFFKNIGSKEWYAGSRKWMEKFGVNGFGEEVMEEEIGIPLNALLVGDNKASDLLDAKQQLDIIGGMAISVGSMYAMGVGTRPVKGIYNRGQYYRFKHKVDVADGNAQQVFGDKWADLKEKMDNATNEQMGGVLYSILQSRGNMSKEQINSAIMYGVNLMKMRGYNLGTTMQMNAKELTGEQDTPEEEKSNEVDNAYSEGHEAEGTDTHDIQIDQADKQKTLAELLGITEEQLSQMDDEQLDSLTGQDDKLDNAIYDYQMSSAKYQGVVDNAQDQVDLAAQQAAHQVDLYTDKSRGMVRNATVKATQGAEDYGVYIISGNLASHDDGTIDISGSDSMIIYFDPKTGTIEHADATRFSALGEEKIADEVKENAVRLAKEEAIKQISGIIDGRVDEGSQFTITDEQGNEHTYEVLADNGDGTAMVTIDGNVPTELVNGETVQVPYSFEDLQSLKDAEDAKRLAAAKEERAKFEAERTGQAQQSQGQPSAEDTLDYSQITDKNGNVVQVEVNDDQGYPKFPDAKEIFLVEDEGYRSKVMVLGNEGNLTSHSVKKSSVQKINEVTLDEYRQMRQEELGANIDETTDIEDEGGTDTSAASEENQASDADATPPIEEKQAPAITLEDGTSVPILEDGNPDFSQLTAQQTAELYDTQFGEDAEGIINGWVSDAKKALDKANSIKVSGRTFVEQKMSKEEKENAIADAQARYDSAMAIANAYNERQLAKEESTSEGRKNLLEKAKAKYNRLKGKAENAQALWNDTVGKVLHRLYDGLGVNVFDHEPQTVEEYVSSSIAPFSLNYEGTETSKGVKQETGLERKDFAKLHILAAEGKGMTIDDFVHKLWDNRPSQFENVSDQEIRNALLDLIMSDMNAYDMRHVIENNRIAQAEKEIEDEKESAENAAMSSQPNEDEETAPTGEEDNEQFPGKLREQSEENAGVPEDSTPDKPLGEQRDDVPFSAKGTEKLETAEERAENVERNRIEDIKVVDAIIGRKTRKALERIAKMMGAKIQWQYSDSMGNGWYDADTNTIHLTLDSSITEGVQFIFGHEMTHEIKVKNPDAYEELRGLVKEMMGEDTFDSMTDATQKRYNNAGVIYAEGRPAYEEEVVADQMGHWLQDANYAHTLAMKMSHPLLAKLHEIVSRIKMALTGTEYTENAKLIMRSIEQAYVKTANGTFESSDTGDRYSLKEANERFNNEIENFKNKSHKGLMHLGAPSPILKACGVDANEITLSPKVLNKKLNQHSLTSGDVKDLVNAIQKPIMVYKHGEKSPNIVVITNANVRGNKLSLALELDTDGNVREMNNVSSIHDKDAETEVKRWLSWDEGYLEKALRWVDKEKVSDWLSSARLNSYSQTEYNQKLSSLAKVLNNFENPKVSEENLHDDVEKVQYSLRQKPEPTKKGIGYKVFVLKDGKLYPPMVANPNGAETPVGVWLDADAAPIAGESKTGRPQVKQGGKGTQGGSGKLAYRPGWHLGVIPYALQFNRKDAEGNKTLFPKNFVFAEVEYAADKDYQDEAHAEGVNENGKYQHSLAGLKHLPTDGYYMYRTNPNPETDPWVITGAMKVNRILTRTEQADLVKAAGREPQQIQDGDIVTDEVVNSINQKIANAPKFSLKVYHGSGADFTEFDFSHMSEGAGSQAFGWGGYVTSSKKIGKDYANIKYDPDKDVEYVGKNKKPFTDLIATLFDGGIRDYDYVKNTLQEISDKDKSNISKKEYDWFVSTKPEDWFNPNPKTNRNLYEVNIPDDNGKNYLGWNEPLTDEQRKIIYNGLVAKNIKSPDLIVPEKTPIGLKLAPTKFSTVYDALSKVYNLGGIQNASQFLSSLGFTGIKYKAGTIMGGAEEGDVNYVIFKPEDMQIAEHTKFSLKGNVDNQGNPLNADGTLKLDKIKSVDDLTNTDFLHPSRNIQMPTLPKRVADAIGVNDKPVIIKKNIFERNYMRHKDVTPEQSKAIFNAALYNPDLYGQNQKAKRPYNWVLINTKDEEGKNRTVLLEVNPNKDNVEIVHWYFVNDKNLELIKKQAIREGDQILILPSEQSEEVGGLSNLTDGLSAAKIDNSSESSKENAEKFSLKDAKEDRIKKLRESKPVEITGKEITPSDDLKQYKKNAKEYGKTLQGTYTNEDTGEVIDLTGGNKRGGIREILQHDYKDIEHLQSIAAIPQIIQKSVFIDELPNEDKQHYPDVKSFRYYVCGLKIDSKDYTVKAVVAEQNNGNRYYDHRLTDIEKGKLLSIIPTIQKAGIDGNMPNSAYKDKRLISILQTNRQKSSEKSSSETKFSLTGVRGAFELDMAEEVTTRLDNLNVARKMEEEKKDAKTIKVATGWERGADGKWRYEMPDAKMKDTIDIGGGHIVKRYEDDILWTDGKLGEYVDAPDLFKAYPQLKDVRLNTDEIVNDMPSNGAYDLNTNTITIHATEVKSLNSILNHEIQHAIQYAEGFAKGGNELTVRGNIKAKLNDVTKEIKRLKAEGKMKEAKVLIEKNKGLYNAYTNNNDFQSYRSLAGEVEARNVQKRMGMTDEERRNSLVSETEDVAREDQIFLGVDNNDIRYSLKNAKEDRIQKLRESKPVEITGKEITPSDDLKQYKKNAKEYGKTLQGTYTNEDTGVKVQLQRGRKNGGVNEVLQHDYKDIPHLQSVAAIPQIIRKSIYIGSEENTDKEKNPAVSEYQYYVCGLKIGVTDYTVRSVFAMDDNGNRYYDHKLTDIEKGKLLDLIDQGVNGSSFDTTSSTELTTANNSVGKDKKLLHILQTNRQESVENSPSEQKYSLRVDRYQDELAEWKKANNLPKDAQRPSVPVREPGESSADFMKRIREYRQQTALWKTAPRYEQHLLYSDTAQGLFNQELQRGSVLARIALQDSMLPIRKAQEAIMKEAGIDRLNIAEDAYTAENRSHGKGKSEFEEYNDEFLQPLRKAYNKMMKNLGKSYDNVKIYMMSKHGLERNAHMAFKKALESDYEKPKERIDAYKAYKADLDRMANDADFEAGKTDFTTWRQKDNAIRTKYAPSFMDYRYDKMGIAQDYSGLSALFEGSDFEEAAADMVRDVESKFKLDAEELWYDTNAATKKVLRDSYKAGMMTKEVYEYVRDMYKNYIPLRGWGDTNADQVWNYMGGGKGAFSQTLKEAKGRGSLADDPIAYIENMAESGILINNKNWVKQHLLLLAQNHPTSLLNVSKAWYIKTVDAQGNEEWIPASPNITAGMTSQQIENELEAFEKKMEKMKQSGDATQKREHLEISYPQTASEEREHEVRVMKDGEEYVIYINGDPQLAQSMNNTRAHRVREGLENSISQKAIAKLGRYMAAAYTSMSPLFIPSNFFRDFTMTLASTAIREDARYNWLLRKNMATHWSMYGMVRSYQEGTLRKKIRDGKASKTERMFYDFMMNGGETGFVSSLDVEDLKKKFKGELKDMDRMALNPKKVGHVIMEEIETLNRAIEDSNRFVVYMTSVEYGRSIEEAVNDAKDVTLNFNRKGTGEHGWQTVRNLYLFINPAIQSLQTLGALAKHHPFKFTAVTTLWLASGLLVPMVNKALMDMFGGDDDKDKYWSFTKWDRRNNFVMWVPFTHEFVKIPLAQEFRGFYGVGDMIASKLWGGEKAEQSWEDYGMDLMGQVIDMLPLDPTGYDGNVAVSMMPNPIRPMFELAFNVDFTGKPLFKDSEYNKYDPNFTKAYAGTPDWLVRISRMVNSVGNEYPDVQQNSIDKFGDPRFNLNNPAVVDHVMSSYLGGAYTMGSQVLGVLTKALNTPGEIKVADIPLVSKFVSNPDDRPAAKKKGDEFWTMKERHDRTANTLSKLKKQAKADGDYSTLEHFYGTGQYAQYKLDEREVKKYQEEKKAETARETGDETYQPKKLTADGVYKNHTTPKDDFEDMKMSQIYPKVNGIKKSWEALADMASGRAESFYDENAEIISAADEVADIRTQITDIKKDFLSDDGKDTFDAEGMRQIRALRKEALKLLERANRKIIAKQKAKATGR